MKQKLTKTLLSKRPGDKNLVAALIPLSIMVFLFFSGNRNLEANGKIVFENKEYWKAFTTSFLHADLIHLGANSISFTILAVLLSTYFGFFIFPLLTLIMGGIINLIVLKLYPPAVYLVGISGVIYFMAAFWLSLYVGVERKQTLKYRWFLATGMSLIFFFPEVFKPEVSYLCHAVGFALGIICGGGYYLINLKKIRSSEIWEEIPDEQNYHDELVPWSEEDWNNIHQTSDLNNNKLR